MKRTLSLSREQLADLTTDDLVSIAGGAQTVQGPTCPLIGCVRDILTDNCYTYGCQTQPC